MTTPSGERPVFDLRTLESTFGAIGGKELQVRVGKEGQVQLDGFVSDEAAAAELRSRAAQLHGVVIEHGYQVIESLRRQILGYLAERNIQLTYQGQGTFVASGRALSHRFAQRAAELTNELRGVIQLDIDAVEAPRAPSEKRPLPLRIVSVQVSAPAQFSTSDGVRYFVGARLPDGAEVVSIQPDRVLFRREGRSIIFQLSREELRNVDAK
jgi:type III secretion system YscD/HrpQ family protein